jgi:hypothetical protein
VLKDYVKEIGKWSSVSDKKDFTLKKSFIESNFCCSLPISKIRILDNPTPIYKLVGRLNVPPQKLLDDILLNKSGTRRV